MLSSTVSDYSLGNRNDIGNRIYSKNRIYLKDRQCYWVCVLFARKNDPVRASFVLYSIEI